MRKDLIIKKNQLIKLFRFGLYEALIIFNYQKFKFKFKPKTQSNPTIFLYVNVWVPG